MTASPPPRSAPLDQLRAIAILGMGLAGLVPFGVLPAWMYHAQSPPPGHQHNPDVFGITWVDLVFPFFLFAMGAAIPFALAKKLDSGTPVWRVCLAVLQRGLVLAAFAIAVQHFRPWTMSSSPDTGVWWRTIGLFLALCAAFARFPKGAPAPLQHSVRGAGVVAILVAFAMVVYPDGSRFDPNRSDIILLILANVAVSASLVWIGTRNNPGLRIAAIGGVLAILLTATLPGLGREIWNWTPAPWLYRFELHKYLLVVLPGTFVGERMLRLAGDRSGEGSALRGVVLFLGLASIAICLDGLLSRQVDRTFFLMAVVGVLLALATRNPQSKGDRLLVELTRWGTCLILIGLLVEPFGGGIRKDSPTLAYYLVPSGLGCYLMAALACLDRAERPNWLTLVGQNPMLAYIGFSSLAPALFRVLTLDDRFASMQLGPWPGAAYAAVKVGAIGAIAVFAAKRGFFLRA